MQEIGLDHHNCSRVSQVESTLELGFHFLPSLLLEPVSRLHLSTYQANLLSNRRMTIWLSTHNEQGLHWWPNISIGDIIWIPLLRHMI
jgi:hypothetical protein